MQEHIRTIHDGEREYKCEVCDYQFSRPNYLKEHIETAHKGITYQCEKCGNDFSSRSYHKIHVATCENIQKEIRCEKCPEYTYVGTQGLSC